MSSLRFFCACLAAVLCLSAAHAQNPAQKTASFNDYILYSVKKMPKGGGYSTGSAAFQNLTEKGVFWNEQAGRLHVSPREAQPSFCSSAAYLVLLMSLQHCEYRRAIPALPREAWQSMAIVPHQLDGQGVWGRVNANGPGFAKLIADLKAGFSFTDYKYAKPGDFIKMFWNEHIGCREFGHLGVFLRRYQDKSGQIFVEFWTSNSGVGFSVKSVKAQEIKRVIFTRITNPAQFSKAHLLPDTDEWLNSLLQKPSSFDEVQKKCQIRN